MTLGAVRSVLGDVDPATLGPVNYHEHFFQASPLLPGDDLDDEDRSTAEARRLRDSGFASVVDATPIGLGRNPEALARLAARSGLTVVATTGRHRDAHYRDQASFLSWSADALAALFISDLTVGMPVHDMSALGTPGESATDREVATFEGSAVRAGVVKAGIDYWRISPAERTALEAIGAAHRATGAPVMVHTEYCSAVDLCLDLLGDEGVSADRVVIAHADRTPDAGLHRDIAQRGAYLGYDGPGRYREWPDEVLIRAIGELVDAGVGDRILLGADVARASRYVEYGGVPGLEYLGRRFVPRLEAHIGDAAVQRILVDNPMAWLTWGRST